MPHLHLSLQSGDDMILKRMKRRHSRADAIRFCDEVRRLRPDIVFGADLIAGFPTETEADVRKHAVGCRGMRADVPARLSLLAAQKHAGRADAAGRPATWSRREPGRMRHAGHSALSAWMSAEVGKTRKILVEGRGRGHTEHYAPVEIDAGERGEIVSARIAGFSDKRLSALAIREAA